MKVCGRRPSITVWSEFSLSCSWYTRTLLKCETLETVIHILHLNLFSTVQCWVKYPYCSTLVVFVYINTCWIVNTATVIAMQADRSKLMLFWLHWKFSQSRIGAWSEHWLMSAHMQVQLLFWFIRTQSTLKTPNLKQYATPHFQCSLCQLLGS